MRSSSAGRPERLGHVRATTTEPREHENALAAGGFLLVRMRGLEPPRAFAHTDLNRARLPIPPHPRGGHCSPAPWALRVSLTVSGRCAAPVPPRDLAMTQARQARAKRSVGSYLRC